MSHDPNIPLTTRHFVDADGVCIFYREAGPSNAPVVLLLHGFPTSSFQYRDLIPRLADRYHVIAPNMPGFGFTQVPVERNYGYILNALAQTLFLLFKLFSLSATLYMSSTMARRQAFASP